MDIEERLQDARKRQENAVTQVNQWTAEAMRIEGEIRVLTEMKDGEPKEPRKLRAQS